MARLLPSDGAGHQLKQLPLEGDDFALFIAAFFDELAKVVDVDDQQPVRLGQVVMKVARPAVHIRLVAKGAVEQVIDQLAANPVLGPRDLALLDHLERDDGGRVLDGHHGELFVALRVIDDREVAEAFASGEHRGDDAAGRQPEFGKGRHLVRHPAHHHLAQHGLDGGRLLDLRWSAVLGEGLLPVFVRDAGDHVGRQQVEVDVFQRDRALDQLTQRLDDRLEALAVEGQVGELAVDLDGAPKLGILGVDDPFEDRVHDLEVRHIGRDTDERDAKLVGLADHVLRDLR